MINPYAYLWTFIGRVGPMLVQFVAMMILAHLLTPQDFGQIGVLSIFLMVANTLNDAGFGGSLIKEKNITQIDCSTVFVYNTLASIIIYIILFLFSNRIEIYFHSNGLANVTKLVCLVFVINSFGMVPKALLSRKLKFKTLTFANLTGVMVASIIGIILAYNDFGVYSLVGYQISQAVVITIFVLIGSKFIIGLNFSKASFKRLFSFGFFTTCCNVVDTIYENSLSFLFGKFLSISQAGYISQAKRMEEVTTSSIAQTINSASFPILSKIQDKNKFLLEIKSLLKVVPSLLFPILMIIPLFSNQIIIITMGRKWVDAAPYLSILTYAGLFMILETLTRNFIKSLGMVSDLLKITMIKRILGFGIIIFTLILYKPYILWGYVAGAFMGFLFNLKLLSSIINVKMVELFILIMKYTMPSIIYLLVCLSLFSISDHLIVKIALSIGLLIAIYYLILKILGVNLKHILAFIK